VMMVMGVRKFIFLGGTHSVAQSGVNFETNV
jgi:hypothetical protein